MFSVLITNEQSNYEVAADRVELAVKQVIEEAGIVTGDVSVAVVDDPTIQELNIQYLNHDYPTDVISFVLEHAEEHLEGEIIVSVDTAVELAKDYGGIGRTNFCFTLFTVVSILLGMTIKIWKQK